MLAQTVKLQVPAWDRPKKGNYIELDAQSRISFLHAEADFALDKLVPGDIVQKVNDKKQVDPLSYEEQLHGKGDVQLEVLRDGHIEPVPLERTAKLGVKRRPQFMYLGLNCGQGDPTKGQPLGIVAGPKEKRIFVGQVAKGSVADGTLIAGDAILELDGESIGDNAKLLIRRISELMQSKGQLKCIVERPIFEHVARAIADDITEKTIESRPQMAADSLEIGCRAAREYLRTGRYEKPKSILISGKGFHQKTKDDKHIEFKEKLEKEVSIGTNVKPNEKLAEPSKDEDKQYGSIRRQRIPFYEDFYDVL
ncbi:unnamed protein product, partial [Mesorhabditis spiculigera]